MLCDNIFIEETLARAKGIDIKKPKLMIEKLVSKFHQDPARY